MTENLVNESEVLALLRRYNPWWDGRVPQELPSRERPLAGRLAAQLERGTSLPTVVHGPRGAGKTVLLHQAAMRLLRGGTPPACVVYAPMRHPLFRQAGFEGIAGAWSRATPPMGSPLFLLIDDIAYGETWTAWLERHSAMQEAVRIAATTALRHEAPQGWLEEALPPLTFQEYLALRGSRFPEIPEQQPLRDLLGWEDEDFQQTAMMAHGLAGQFNEYLRRGAFYGAVGASTLNAAEAYLREQVIVRALREDLPQLAGVRRVAEVENLFLHLCRESGGLVELQDLSGRLGISKNTLRKHLRLLEQAHLVYSLKPFGYGREVKRGRMRILIADASLAWALLLRGQDVFEDPQAIEAAVEACIYRHVFHRPTGNPTFSYWRGVNEARVNFVATGGRGQSRAFMIAYGARPGGGGLAGLQRFCAEKNADLAYVITRDLNDFGLANLHAPGRGQQEMLPARVLRIPAALFAYWMS